MVELEERFREFLKLARPTFVATETPFMRRAKLSAYESGVELQLMLRRTLWDVFPEKYLHGFNPIIVKSYVGVEAKGTDKSHMQQAVTKLYANHTRCDLSVLDEHSIDAVAVGNIFVRVNLLNLNSLLPPKVKVPKAKAGNRKEDAGGNSDVAVFARSLDGCVGRSYPQAGTNKLSLEESNRD
ncbi:hypothetical protein N5V81_13640 [Escherichia coli]|nr:hypothetical protein [Escherichia coli]